MKNMDNQKILDNIEKEVFIQLKLQGFKKKGRTFNRKTDEGIYQVINFQAGQYPIGDNYVVPGLRENLYGKFTINLGICVEDIFVINFPHKTKDFYLEYDCQFRKRLSTLMKGDDYWWPLIKNPETVINEIIEGMSSLGLPWLNLFATRENILDNSQHLDKGRAKFDLGIIMLKIDKEKGINLIQEYVNELKPSQNSHKEVVIEIAKELGLKINKTSA